MGSVTDYKKQADKIVIGKAINLVQSEHGLQVTAYHNDIVDAFASALQSAADAAVQERDAVWNEAIIPSPSSSLKPEKVVAAHDACIRDAAVLVEREACAAVADDVDKRASESWKATADAKPRDRSVMVLHNGRHLAAREIAYNIRLRG